MARSTWLVIAIGMLVGCQASKRDFLDHLEPKVVALLCDQDRPADRLPSYYRTCFRVDESQCLAVMGRNVHVCADQFARDGVVVDESNAGTIAERLGACAGTSYELELDRQGKQIRSDACDLSRDVYAKDRASKGKP